MKEDGSLHLHIKSAPSRSIIKWILSEGRNARLIKPKELADEIGKQAIIITDYHKGMKT